MITSVVSNSIEIILFIDLLELILYPFYGFDKSLFHLIFYRNLIYQKICKGFKNRYLPTYFKIVCKKARMNSIFIE